MDTPQAPGEAPHRVAATAGKKGLQGLKNLPPWAWLAVAGALIVMVLYLRHKSANTTSSQDASTASTDSTGDSSYGSDGYGYQGDTSGLGSQSGYDLGYSQGLSAADSYGMGMGGLNGSGQPNQNSPVTADGGGGGISITEPTINLSIPTGGGSPHTGGSGVHGSPSKNPTKPKGQTPKPPPKSAPKKTTGKSPLGATLSNLKPAKPPPPKKKK